MDLYNVHHYCCRIDGIFYQINQLQLTLADNNIQSCQFFLVNGIKKFSMSTTNALLDIYKKVALQAANYPEVQICDQDTQTIFFKGVLIGVQPGLAGAVNSAQGIRCQALGSVAQLLYNPVADYVVAPPGTQNPANLALSGLGTNPTIYNWFSKSAIKLQNLTQKTTFTDKTLQTIFIETAKQLQIIKNKQLTGDKTAEDQRQQHLKIQQYIKSDWKLGDILIPAQDKAQGRTISPFVRQLNARFVRNILGGATTFQAVKGALYGDTLLKIRPSGDGSYMYIQPDYLYKWDGSEQTTLRAKDLYSLNAHTNVDQKILQPGTLYINFAKVAQFLPAQKAEAAKKTPSGIYGTYVSNQKLKTFKFLPGPTWLTQYVGNELRKNNSNLDYKLVYDTFAKFKFFTNFNIASSCNLTLAVSDKTLNLRNYVGKSIFIDTRDICLGKYSSTIWQSLQGFYGMLTSYRFGYSAAQDQKSTSNAVITITVQRFTPKQSDMASVFQNGIEQILKFFKKTATTTQPKKAEFDQKKSTTTKNKQTTDNKSTKSVDKTPASTKQNKAKPQRSKFSIVTTPGGDNQTKPVEPLSGTKTSFDLDTDKLPPVSRTRNKDKYNHYDEVTVDNRPLTSQQLEVINKVIADYYDQAVRLATAKYYPLKPGDDPDVVEVLAQSYKQKLIQEKMLDALQRLRGKK